MNELINKMKEMENKEEDFEILSYKNGILML